MNYFWPRRPSPKGFSIEGLARKYKEKISSRDFLFTKKIPTQLISPREQIDNHHYHQEENSLRDDRYEVIHWANRSYDEYLDAA